MNGQGNLVLIGYRGTGKSTVAQLLGARMQRAVHSSDEHLVQRAGASIPEYVAAYGWDAFRDLEQTVLSDLCQQSQVILDCGGGVILRPANRQILRDAGRVVWLRARPETIRGRIAENRDRPSLTGKSFLDEIAEVLVEREPLYAETSHWILDGDALTPEEMTERILAWWGGEPAPTEV